MGEAAAILSLSIERIHENVPKELRTPNSDANRQGVGPARFGLATSRLSAGRSNRAKLRAHKAARFRDG